jgi:large repetitive protein
MDNKPRVPHLRRARKHFLQVFAMGYILLAGVSDTHAQVPPPQFDVQTYHPSPHGEGILDVESGNISPHLSYHVGTWFNFSEKPLSLQSGDNGARLGDIVARRIDIQLALSLALFRWVSLGFEIPFVAYQTGLNTDIAQLATGIDSLQDRFLGDIRANIKTRILLGEGLWPALAAGIVGTIPTGQPGHFAGQAGVALEAYAAASKRLFGFHELALQMGYRFRTKPMTVTRDLSIGNEFYAHLGYALFITPPRHPTNWALLFNLAAFAPQNNSFWDLQEADHSLELRAAVRYRNKVFGGFMDFTVGLGLALLPGYGAPMPRVLVAANFLSINPRGDNDFDRVYNIDDLCPDEVEDWDDFEDWDGCPEEDNDNDGLPDEDDDCPNTPEDWDQVDDTDGCPDADPVDADMDGIYDELDKCPNEPEDRDNFKDRDGCPDLDNDLDGLLDINDLCPNQAEDFDGDQDDDGCPDLGATSQLVRLMGDRVLLRDPIAFTPGDQEVEPGSVATFDRLVEYLLSDAKAKILLIQVFATSKDENGEKAAKRRIKAVRKLFDELGIGPDRLAQEIRPYQEGREGEVQFRFNEDELEIDFDDAAPGDADATDVLEIPVEDDKESNPEENTEIEFE